MRTSIWDAGAYAGFPTNPPLQLMWFVDQAIAQRQQHVAAGDLAYGADESRYGEWVADVERPAEQFRGRYQLRLGEARTLIGPVCVDAGPGGQPPPPPPEPTPLPPSPDVTAPALAVARALGRLPLARTLSVPVRCPTESCVAWATGSVTVPTAARVYRVAASRRTVAPGTRAVMKLPLGRKLRNAVAAALADGRKVRGAIVVHAADPSGNETTARSTFRLRRP